MRRRLLRNAIGLVLITALVLGVPLAVVSSSLAADGVRSAIAVRAESIAAALGEQVAETGRLDLARTQSSVPVGWRLELRRPGGQVDSVGADVSPSMIAVSVPVAGGELTLRSPDDDLQAARWGAFGLVGAAIAAALLVGVGVALVTARRMVSPLSVLTERAARLGAGDFRTSPQRFGVAELDRVAEVLDASAQQVAALLRDERELAADVSHQLRTRLTGIQLRLDELAEHPDPAVRAEVGPALQQTERLVAVVNDLLAATRSRRAATASSVDLGSELAEIGSSWRDAFARAGRRLDVAGGTGLRVRATPVRLREALGVLVDNALAYGDGIVRIRVEQSRDQAWVLIEVTDEGPGIADALVPHVFDRGISGAASTGLGLGLARAFVEADGGRLELRRPRPATFGLFLAADLRAGPTGH